MPADAPAALSGSVSVVRLPYIEGVSPCGLRNAALRRARTPWVFLLDSDAEPAEDCLERLWEALSRRPSAVLVCPRILRPGPPERVDHDPGGLHFLGEMCLENAGRAVEETGAGDGPAAAASATALLVRRDAALEAGGFDEGLVFYREDLDFCLSLRGRGGLILRCPEARVIHRPYPGARRLPGDLHRLRAFYQTRNRWWILLKHLEGRTLLLTLPLQLLYEALNLALCLRRGEGGWWLRAFLDLGLRAGPLLRARRRARAERSASDRELLGAPRLAWRAEVRALPGAGAARALLDAACAAWWRAAARLL